MTTRRRRGGDPADPGSDPLIRLPQAAERTGIEPRAILTGVTAGTFPPPRRVSRNIHAWLTSEVDAWREAQNPAPAIKGKGKRPRGISFLVPRPIYVPPPAQAPQGDLLTEQQINGMAKPWAPDTSRSGIYFLIAADRIDYIGQSTDVPTRVQAHRKTRRFESWAWIACVPEELLRMERAYLDRYLPHGNADFATILRRKAIQREIQRARLPGTTPGTDAV